MAGPARDEQVSPDRTVEPIEALYARVDRVPALLRRAAAALEEDRLAQRVSMASVERFWDAGSEIG